MMPLGDALTEISLRGDWRRVNDLYRQFSAGAEAARRGRLPGPPNAVAGALAEALARVFSSYRDIEPQFVADVALLFGEIDQQPTDPVERFRRLYYEERLSNAAPYKPHGTGRRRPPPFEAVVETIRRLQDLNALRGALVWNPSSAVLGGSVSYGRFFNTGGGQKPSDLDLLLIVPDYTNMVDLPARLRKLAFVSQRDVDTMETRIGEFLGIRSQYERCVFLQKLRLWDGERRHPYQTSYQLPCFYKLAVHVLSIDDFLHLTFDDRPRLDVPRRVIYEYRNDAPSGHATELRSFAGLSRNFEQGFSKEPNGFVAEEVVAEVVDGRFYPGVHLSLILPQFEVRWESPSVRIRLPLQALHGKLLTRLADERQARNFEVQLISLAHARVDVFAPHITARVDRA